MALFLIIFLGIYGGMHAYFLFKFQQVVPLHGLKAWAVLLFLLLMLAGPIIVRTLERGGFHLPARILAYVAYTWMALLLWFLFLSLARDVWNTAVRLAAKAAPSLYPLVLPVKPAMAVIGVIVLALAVWGFFEARSIRVDRVTVRSSALPAGTKPIRIAQISDIHFGLIERYRRLEQILEILFRESPDMVVCTGDMVDGMGCEYDSMTARMAAYQPPLGKFSVTGNHEFYAGIEDSLCFHRESGFKVLRGEAVDVGEHLRVAGVDDPAGSRTGSASYTDEKAALDGDRGSRFVLLLKHQPRLRTGSRGLFDLQLSGHTHKGQIFPFNYPVRLSYPYLAGLYNVGGGSLIYTNRGTGTWGPPLRVLSPAEVTIFSIAPQESSESR